MLARTLERAGLATVIVTMMPVWSERIGAPRTLAVPHPYGQPMGPVGDRARQRQVLRRALSMLESAREPGHIEESQFDWPEPQQAKRDWQPSKPAPIIRHLAERQRAGEPTGLP